MTQKNEQLSLLDNDQLIRREHDQATDAKRVIIVGGQVPDYSEQIKEGLKNLTLAVPSQTSTQEVRIERIEVPVIVTEIRTVEVPVIVKEIHTVEVPVIQKELQIERIEVPTIVESIRIIEIPIKEKESKLMHWLLIAQTLASIILSIIHLNRK